MSHMARYLENVAARPDVQALHARAAALLDLQPGQRVLDAGCGTGAVARRMLTAVGPTGRVVGIDPNPEMVDTCERLSPGVTVHRAALPDLPFDTASFDAVHCERVLQHVRPAQACVAELLRVCRPGGRVALVDTDWLSLTVDVGHPALTAAVLAPLERLPQPQAGARLGEWLAAAGAVEVVAEPVVFALDDLADAATVLPMLDPSLPQSAGLVPEHLRDPWFTALRFADAEGSLRVRWTAWVAAGAGVTTHGTPLTALAFQNGWF